MDININLDTVYNLTLNTGMVGRRMVVWDHQAQAISYEWGLHIIQICQYAINTRFQLIFLSILRVKTYLFRMSDKCYATERIPSLLRPLSKKGRSYPQVLECLEEAMKLESFSYPHTLIPPVPDTHLGKSDLAELVICEIPLLWIQILWLRHWLS